MTTDNNPVRRLQQGAASGRPIAMQDDPFVTRQLVAALAEFTNASGAAAMPQSVTSGAIGTDAKIVMNSNARRGYLYIQNNSAADIWLAYDSLPTEFNCIIIGPGGYYEPRVVPTNSIAIRSATLTDARWSIVEGVRS